MSNSNHLPPLRSAVRTHQQQLHLQSRQSWAFATHLLALRSNLKLDGRQNPSKQGSQQGKSIMDFDSKSQIRRLAREPRNRQAPTVAPASIPTGNSALSSPPASPLQSDGDPAA
ncbi:hypothetical protein ACLOJK_025262 [Asimina triloba]